MKKIVVLLILASFSWMAKSQQENLQELLNRKQYNQIVLYVDQLQASDSSDFQTMYVIGQAYEGLLRYRDAYRYYQHCLMLDTKHVELLNTTGRMAANLGKINEAEDYFLKIWETDTADFYANYQLARFYAQSGNDLQAASYYEYLLEQDPNNPALLRAAGDCYSRMNDKSSAVILYGLAFQNNKENAGLASTFINTILPLPDEEKIEKALAVCDTALYYNPGHITLLQNKGMTFFTGRKYAQADSVYSILLAQGDSSFNTVKYCGSSRYHTGKTMNAIEPLEKAHFLDPTDVEVCLLLGSALGRTYDRKRALDLFEWVETFLLPQNQAYGAYLAYTDLLLQFRAETFTRDGRRNEAAAIYYQQWLTSKRSDKLYQIWTQYGFSDLSRLENDDVRARSLFICVLIATDQNTQKNNSGWGPSVRRQLVAFREDMFFRGIKEHPMIAPDNKRSTMTEVRLQELIKQLPERIQQ
jgi:tetratricopeptide (TPR) repeat protein